MPIANWTTQPYHVIQSLLFNNPQRVIHYLVRDEHGDWQDRARQPAPARPDGTAAAVTRLYETEASPERTCLQTIQFVHHMLIPPGGRHVAELHIHPDAEEIVVVTQGTGRAFIGEQEHAIRQGDVVYVGPSVEHEFRNTGDELLGVLFINAPVGDGLQKLLASQCNG